MKLLLPLLLVLGLGATGRAQADSLQLKIERLLELSGAEAQFTESAVSMIELQRQQPHMSGIPAAWFEEFIERIRTDGWRTLAPELAAIYRKHYTETEIDYLIDYHSHPMTQSITAKIPAIQQESMLVGQAWGQEIARQLVEKASSTGEGNR